LADAAIHVTAAVVWDRLTTAVMNGAPGGARTGTTDAEATEAEPAPIAFRAVTVKVYEVPLVKPVTVHGFTSAHATGVWAVVATYGVSV
jgi:hypothetical protein